MKVNFYELLMIWIGWIAVSGFAMGLFAHYIQDMMNSKPADVNVNFHYNAEEVAGTTLSRPYPPPPQPAE